MISESEVKIGINIGKVIREGRGITVYTRNILDQFGNLDYDYRFVLLHYPKRVPEDKFGIDKAELVPLPYSENWNPWATILGEQLLNPWQQRELGLDVVWHPHNRCQFIVPVGYVSTLHDILPLSCPELASQYLNSLGKRLLYLTRTFSARRANMIITGSEFSRQEITRHLGVNPEKVITIHYGVDRQVFKPNKSEEDRERIRKTYLLPSSYILTTGSYAPHKNLPFLVDAYNQSNLPKENVELVMVGPNDTLGYRIGYHQTEEHVKQLGLAEKVKLLPTVPINDLVALYSNAKFFVITSLHEGFGLTPLEAMACEVPVVASNVSALPEVCGSAALYADPHDPSGYVGHFNTLIEDENLRQRLIENGQTQVRKYDWQTTARKTLDILRSVALARR